MTVAAVLSAGPGHALPSNQAIPDLKHSAWTVENGAPPGIQAIAQSTAGYLLIGSWRGLFRFDGVIFERVAPPTDTVPRSDEISALKTLGNGDTWVGYRSGDLAIYRNGHLVPLAIPRHAASIREIEEEQLNGCVWIKRDYKLGEILRYCQGAWTEVNEGWGLPKKYISRILAARDNTIWVTLEKELYYLPQGSLRFVRSPETTSFSTDVEEDRAGRIWLYDETGIRRLPLDHSKSAGKESGLRYPSPAPLAYSFRMMFDRDDNLWSTAETGGVVRIRRPADDAARPERSFDTYLAANGLTSDIAGPLIEDREGNVWVATTSGIDRFRAARAVQERGIPAGQPSEYLLRAASDGSVYAADSDSFYRIPPGGTPKKILGSVNPLFLCEGSGGEMWLGTYQGLRRYKDDKITSEALPLPKFGNGALDCAVDHDGSLWVGAGDAALLRRAPSGAWSNNPVIDPEHEIFGAIMPDSHGRILLGYRGSVLKRIDLPSFNVVWSDASQSLGRLQSLERDGEDLYIIGPEGIVRVRGENSSLIKRAEHPELQGLIGMARSHDEIWLLSAMGVLHIPSAEFAAAFDQPGTALHFSVIDIKDGLPGTAMLGGGNHAAAGGDGRLWFAMREGVARIDPSEIKLNRSPPPVLIESAIADGVRTENPNNLTLGRGVRSLEIDYTALSLTAPDRARFRYKLEGVDRAWVEAGARRQAFYTNLAPGSYQFQVSAANEDGVWNTESAALEFEIPPTFFQSLPFKVLCALVALALLWLIYSFRLRTIAGRLRMAATARLNERERIARELHDTLLQGFQGLMLRLQAVAERSKNEPEQAHRLIEQTLERADAVLEQGRDRVKDLRASDAGPIDLSRFFLRVAEDAQPQTTKVRVTVEGAPRQLRQVVGEEIEKIGSEAITNALRHAKASTIDVNIVFERGRFALRISDDGIGIEAGVAHDGREGHFGLTGMRERAQQIRGTISIASRPNAGTEIEIIVPGGIAYVPRRVGSARLWLRRLAMRGN